MPKISEEMRAKLREPLPSEAVSQHPTKTYLSSIKSIYVAERLNDVFGIGSWTLKSTPIEMAEKMVVVQGVLEIPEYGFYGESYGGNDNADRGDAYKGATTDALTKIAAQQLEIGIDVFKGLQTGGGKPPEKSPEKAPTQEHWCKEHNTEFFKRGAMKSYAHQIGKTREWCNEHVEPPQATEKPTKGEYSSKPQEVPEPKEITYIGEKEHLPMGEYEGQELTIVETGQVIKWHQSAPNTGQWLGQVGGTAADNPTREIPLDATTATQGDELPIEDVPADVQAFLTWASSHGKKYGPTWLSNQFHVTMEDLKDATLRAKLYADVKAMMNW